MKTDATQIADAASLSAAVPTPMSAAVPTPMSAAVPTPMSAATSTSMSTPMPSPAPVPAPAPAPMAPDGPAGDPTATPPRTNESRRVGLGTVGALGVVAVLAVLLATRRIEPSDLALPVAWRPLQPELVILLFALMAPIVALSDNDRRGMRSFTLVALGGALVMVFLSLIQFDWTLTLGSWSLPISFDFIATSEATATDAVGNVLRVTYASQLFKLVFLGVAFLAVLGVGRPFRGRVEEDWGEFCSLVLFAVLGMMVVASARDLFVLWLGVEMASMSSYVLAGFRRDAAGAEASLKYFTIGAICSGLAIFAISLIYGMAGTTSIDELRGLIIARGPFDLASTVPIVMLLAGLGFKISSVPFHAWAPDVYSGAPTPVVGLLAAASKAMGFAALFTVFLVGLPSVKANWEVLVALVAVASMFFGNLVALQQTNVRRMLAYSSIAQAGYILIAVAVGGSAQDGGVWAVGGGIFHLMANAAMKLGAFIAVGALLASGLPDQLSDWRGLGRRAPVLAFAMVLFLLSMAGLPPLGGFASKFVLFGAAIDAGVTANLGWLTILAILAVVNSAISLYVYLRFIRAMYVEDGEPGHISVPSASMAAVVVCAVLVVLMGIWWTPFVDASFAAARSLLGLQGLA